MTQYLDDYDTVKATRQLGAFVDDLSTWYLRRSRGREDQAFLSTLQEALREFAKLIAPVMPYVSETIYQNLTGGQSVHLEDWPKMKKLSSTQQKLLAQMQEVRGLVEQAHALRAQAGVKLRQPLAKLTIPREVILESRRGVGMIGSQDSIAALQNDRVWNELLEILKHEVNVLEIEYGQEFELDTKITPDLKLAGLARELERQINQFRKEAGLKIGESVDLYYETKSAKIEEALRQVDKKKTYLVEISNIKYQKSKMDSEKELVVEGEKVWIGLIRK